jgi:hypothetical protein
MTVNIMPGSFGQRGSVVERCGADGEMLVWVVESRLGPKIQNQQDRG